MSYDPPEILAAFSRQRGITFPLLSDIGSETIKRYGILNAVAAVAPGNRFSIAFDVTPKPRIHVYAPGASGYRVVGVTITPQPFVRVLPLEYPKSEIYFFKPLNERVPVYAKPFTLVQELVLEGHPEAQAALRGKDSVTVTGALDYQACDDQV